MVRLGPVLIIQRVDCYLLTRQRWQWSRSVVRVCGWARGGAALVLEGEVPVQLQRSCVPAVGGPLAVVAILPHGVQLDAVWQWGWCVVGEYMYVTVAVDSVMKIEHEPGH